MESSKAVSSAAPKKAATSETYHPPSWVHITLGE